MNAMVRAIHEWHYSTKENTINDVAYLYNIMLWCGQSAVQYFRGVNGYHLIFSDKKNYFIQICANTTVGIRIDVAVGFALCRKWQMMLMLWRKKNKNG
jgi:hypothetical protein